MFLPFASLFFCVLVGIYLSMLSVFQICSFISMFIFTSCVQSIIFLLFDLLMYSLLVNIFGLSVRPSIHRFSVFLHYVDPSCSPSFLSFIRLTVHL